MNKREKILKDIKNIDKEAYKKLTEIEMPNDEMKKLYEMLLDQKTIVEMTNGYLGDGVYISMDGSTYSE